MGGIIPGGIIYSSPGALDDTATRDSKGFAEQTFSFRFSVLVLGWKGCACGKHEWGTPLRLDETADIETCANLGQ